MQSPQKDRSATRRRDLIEYRVVDPNRAVHSAVYQGNVMVRTSQSAQWDGVLLDEAMSTLPRHGEKAQILRVIRFVEEADGRIQSSQKQSPLPVFFRTTEKGLTRGHALDAAPFFRTAGLEDALRVLEDFSQGRLNLQPWSQGGIEGALSHGILFNPQAIDAVRVQDLDAWLQTHRPDLQAYLKTSEPNKNAQSAKDQSAPVASRVILLLSANDPRVAAVYVDDRFEESGSRQAMAQRSVEIGASLGIMPEPRSLKMIPPGQTLEQLVAVARGDIPGSTPITGAFLTRLHLAFLRALPDEAARQFPERRLWPQPQDEGDVASDESANDVLQATPSLEVRPGGMPPARAPSTPGY